LNISGIVKSRRLKLAGDVRNEEGRNPNKFWWGNLFKTGDLEDHERNDRMTL
jgi:hypothetical protein